MLTRRIPGACFFVALFVLASAFAGCQSDDTGTPFEELLEQYENRASKVTYDVSGTIWNSKVVWYRDGEGGNRQDNLNDDGSLVNTNILAGDTSVFCETELAFCRSPGYDIVVLEGLLVGASSSEQVPVATTIAGEEAKCFQAESDMGSAEYCFASDGVLLRLVGQSEGELQASFEAIEISRDIDDEDFDPPFDIVTAD